MKKTRQTNIAVNDPYDAKLCQIYTVYTDFLPQC